MSERKFRGSLFGGFNRRDVVDYIEKTAQRTAEYRANSEKLRDAEDRIRELEAASRQLQGQLAQSQTENDRLAGENQTLQDAASEREAVMQAFRQRMEDAEKDASEYRAARDRIAKIELDAVKRAVVIEKDAHIRAAEVSAKCSELMNSLRGEYAAASEDAETTAAHIRSEAERISGRLNSLTAMLSEGEHALEELQARYEERCKE